MFITEVIARRQPEARLPELYQEARDKLEKCDQIDECKRWSDSAEMLASYARQAHDPELEKFVRRIKARAVRRCGELLSRYTAQGKRVDLEPTEGAHGKLSQREAAAQAGLSEHQQLQASRVSRVPEPEFDAAVDADSPPTLAELARMGTRTRRGTDLRTALSADADNRAQGYRVQSMKANLRELAERDQQDAEAIVAATHPQDLEALEHQALCAASWVTNLASLLSEERREAASEES